MLRRCVQRGRCAGARGLATAARGAGADADAASTVITTLPNGATLAVDETPSYFSSVGFYFKAGSRFESRYQLEGASHLLDKMSYKSTEKHTLGEMSAQLNTLGGNYMCSSSRECMIYQASVFNNDIDRMTDLVSESIFHPRLTPDEFHVQKQAMAYELNELWLQPNLILPELFQQTAYSAKNLGSPLICPPQKLPELSLDLLHQYRNLFYSPNNLVVAFSGVSAEKAQRLAEAALAGLSSRPLPQMDPAVYTGGELAIPYPEGIDHLEEFHNLTVGFEGIPITNDNVYKLAILQMLIGQGGSFSAGGPGKGMYSRSYTRILNQYGFVESCKSFIHNYQDSGLFGVSLACIPQGARVMAELVSYELNLLMSNDIGKGGISQQEFDRAKNQLKSSLYMNLESNLVRLEDLGRQIQIFGKKVDISEMCAKIDNVSRLELIETARTILTGSKPTVVIQGNRDAFGDVNGMLQRYGLGKWD